MTEVEPVRRHVLRIYISPDCPSCRAAERVAATVRQVRPRQPVELIDVAVPGAAVPEGLVGTPTYRLADVTVALGNPSLPELLCRLDTAAVEGDGGQ